MSAHVPVREGPHNFGVFKRYRFENGRGASVIRGPYTYGGEDGLWEVAVLNANEGLDYSTPITSDVLGRLTWAEVEATLDAIAALPPEGR